MSGFNDRPFCGTNNGQNERTKMKKKRLLSLILAALTVSVTLASCVGQTGEDETTAGAETTVGDETPDELVRQLYGERDYGGASSVFSRSAQARSGTILSAAKPTRSGLKMPARICFKSRYTSATKAPSSS